MTGLLRSKSFAADVSHELKNPLTSLRSAVETLPLAKTDELKKRLMDVIQHDVRRLDRLISDISDASLDAELARADAKPVDLEKLLAGLCEISGEVRARGKTVAVTFQAERKNVGKSGFKVVGHELRLGQIITNLIENARSFVPDEGGRIDVRLSRKDGNCRVAIEHTAPVSGRTIISNLRLPRYRPAGCGGFRPEFRPRPFDQPADRRGAWRHARGRECARRERRTQGCALRPRSAQ